jgi:hypothetical protein
VVVGAIVDATIAAAVIVVDDPTIVVADAPVDVSNAAPAVPAALAMIAAIKADVPARRDGRNLFLKCSRPVRM